MKISERQLRGIIREEMIHRTMNEAAAAPAAGLIEPYTTKSGDTISSVLKARYGIPLSKANYTLYNQVAKLSRLTNADNVPPGTILQLAPIIGGKARIAVPAAAGAPAGADQLPGCNLASLKAPLTQQLTSIAKVGVGVAFYVDLIVGQAAPVQPADLIAAGQTLAGMGDQTSGGWVKQLIASGLDTLAGPMNEFVGAMLTFLGTWMQGVVNAKTAFISGGPGVKCSFKALAASVGKAYIDAIGSNLSAIASGYSSIASGIKMFAQVVVGILVAAGGAVASAATLIGQVLVSLVNLGVAGIRGLGALIQQAIIAAGDSLIAAGTATKAAAGAPPVSESVRIRTLDRLALEMCTLTYARNLLRENVSIENRALVLL